MADTVRYFLEKMVPELDDLEEKGYFLRAELREIVSKREAFEYALKRRPPLKEDFVRYINYEQDLSELLQLRAQDRNIELKSSKGPAGISTRCHTLHDRATRKFKGDLSLWLSWIDYCEATDSKRQMSRVLTMALKLHPKTAGLWVRAAAWEFEHNSDPARARKLMQQGLRVCKDDRHLWDEYFRMELAFASRLRARREVLGLPLTADGRTEDLEAQGSPAGTDAMADVLAGAAAGLVAREAIAREAGGVAVRRRLLDVLQEFEGGRSTDGSAPAFSGVEAEIAAGLEAECSGSEDAWDLLARLGGRRGGVAGEGADEPAGSSADAVYERGLQALPTTAMYDRYLDFLTEQVGDSKLTKGRLKGRERRAAKKALQVIERAREAGKLSERAALAWPGLELQCGRPAAALRAAEAATECFPLSTDLWSQRIILIQESARNARQDTSEAAEEQRACLALQRTALLELPLGAAAELWSLILSTPDRLPVPLGDVLDDMLKRVAARSKAGPIDDPAGDALAAAIKVAHDTLGIAAARSFHRRLRAFPACGAAPFNAALDLEITRPAAERLARRDMTAIFEAALAAYGKEDAAMWQRYAAYEEDSGRGAGAIYWRATQALADPESFIARAV